MSKIEDTTTIPIDHSDEDEVLILDYDARSGDDFLTTNYSQEGWEDEPQLPGDDYL